jgi:hypothetical protein
MNGPVNPRSAATAVHPVQTVLAGGLWSTYIDPNQLKNSQLNSAVNFRDATPDGDQLTIEAALRDSLAQHFSKATR